MGILQKGPDAREINKSLENQIYFKLLYNQIDLKDYNFLVLYRRTGHSLELATATTRQDY